MPGVVALQTKSLLLMSRRTGKWKALNEQLKDSLPELNALPLLILCDDADFVTATLQNFLWVSFTRCNPSHDMYGIESGYENKHWYCKGPLILDARIKPHHAPPVEKDARTERNIERLFNRGGSLYGKI